MDPFFIFRSLNKTVLDTVKELYSRPLCPSKQIFAYYIYTFRRCVEVEIKANAAVLKRDLNVIFWLNVCIAMGVKLMGASGIQVPLFTIWSIVIVFLRTPDTC